MSNESSIPPSNRQTGNAMLQALWVTLAIVVTLKVLTGLAFAPLAVIAFVVWIIAFGMSIRLKRIPRRR